ncbi:MAG: hypothetical protein ACYDA1_07595 [Vulcanimicrobiaceae bacterium]
MNDHRKRGVRTILAGSIGTLLLGLVAVVGLTAQGSGKLMTFTLTQSKPQLHSTTVNPSKPHDGDELTVFATLSENGKVVGHLSGVKVIVRSGTDAGASDLAKDHDVLRMATLQFSFSGNDSFLVQGLSLDNINGMVAGDPEVRAIIGGTGKYAFSRGQVTSTRNADGSYTHKIELRM